MKVELNIDATHQNPVMLTRFNGLDTLGDR